MLPEPPQPLVLESTRLPTDRKSAGDKIERDHEAVALLEKRRPSIRLAFSVRFQRVVRQSGGIDDDRSLENGRKRVQFQRAVGFGGQLSIRDGWRLRC